MPFSLFCGIITEGTKSAEGMIFLEKKFDALILAYDSEKMNSAKHLVCHEAAGKSLINWVTDALSGAGAEKIYVVCDKNAEEIKISAREKVIFISPDEAKKLDSDAFVVTNANTPLLTGECIKKAVNAAEEYDIVTVISSDGALLYALGKEVLTEGAKCGFDFSKVCGKTKKEIKCDDAFCPIEDRVSLSVAEANLRKRINEKLMYSGVTIIDPERTYISDEVEISRDTVILPGCILKGKTVIGEGCVIGPDTTLENVIIGNGTTVQKTVGMDCVVNTNTTVGPFAYLRPNTVVGDNCRIGDFVELKNSFIGSGTKVSHLTYVGDSDVGERVNFGCGTVTVNYDGAKKYRTTIGNDCFIGCNSNLVAPVTLEDGAYTAAGSTITDNVPEKTLAIARARQVNKDTWNDRRKAKNK